MRVLALRSLARTCALLTVAASAAPSAAQASAPVPFSFSAVGTADYHRFDVRAADDVRGAVRVVNRSGRTRVVRLQALDLVTGDRGGIVFRSGRPAATGRWLRLDRRDVRLRPGAAARVGYTARVPSRVSPGEHYAGIVAIDRADLRAAGQRPSARRGVVLRHVTRLALPVRFTVAGPADRRMAAGRADFAADAAGSRIDLPLRSTGAKLIRSTKVDVAVRDERGRTLFTHRATLAEFVPRTIARYPITWRGRAAEGRYRLVGTVSPKGAPAIRVDQKLEFTRRRAQDLEEQTGEQAAPAASPPLLLLAGLAVALLAAIAATVAYVRLRRRLRAAQVSTPIVT